MNLPFDTSDQIFSPSRGGVGREAAERRSLFFCLWPLSVRQFGGGKNDQAAEENSRPCSWKHMLFEFICTRRLGQNTFFVIKRGVLECHYESRD